MYILESYFDAKHCASVNQKDERYPLACPFVYRFAGNTSTWRGLAVQVVEVAAMSLIVGFAATFGPARRVLHVRPTEALRAE